MNHLQLQQRYIFKRNNCFLQTSIKYFLLFVVSLQFALAQKDVDTSENNLDTLTIENKFNNNYSLDKGTWAGLGTGIHFSDNNPFQERMIVMLTNEYRFENIVSFLLEFQWWNTDGGIKKSLVFSSGIKGRLYIENINIFLQGGIGYSTSFPINLPTAVGIEFPAFQKWRLNMQLRTGLSNGDSTPSFFIISLITSY